MVKNVIIVLYKPSNIDKASPDAELHLRMLLVGAMIEHHVAADDKGILSQQGVGNCVGVGEDGLHASPVLRQVLKAQQRNHFMEPAVSAKVLFFWPETLNPAGEPRFATCSIDATFSFWCGPKTSLDRVWTSKDGLHPGTVLIQVLKIRRGNHVTKLAKARLEVLASLFLHPVYTQKRAQAVPALAYMI